MKANIKTIWSSEWENNTENRYFVPVLVTCRVPESVSVLYVALTNKSCQQSTHYFQLQTYRIENKRKFTVCVKPLDFLEDISRKLVEWIEINRVLGAEKLDIYVKRVRRNVYNILQWYHLNSNGFVNIRKFKYVNDDMKYDGQLNYNTTENYLKYFIWQKRRYELVTYNDCFYRNHKSSDYVIPLDIDEIIVPRYANTWHELLNTSITYDMKEQYASFTVQNAYYLRTFTINSKSNNNNAGMVGHDGKKEKEPVFFLYDITRSELSAQGESGKSFISTKNTLTVFNHYALNVLRPGVRKCYFFQRTLYK